MRKLAGRGRLARSQDALVELAVDRLYEELREEEEGALWDAAADDPEFQAEMKAIVKAYRDADAWPK